MSQLRRVRRKIHVDVTARRQRKWVIRLLCGGALFVSVFGVGGWLTLRYLRSSQTADTLDVVNAHMTEGNWAEAARLLREVQRAAPQDTAVVRTVANFQIHTKANPADIAQTLRRLTDHGAGTAGDLMKLARAEIQHDNINSARETLGRLPEPERSSAEAIELEATMLKLEGRHQEAEERLRAALMSTPGNRTSEFKLALLDYKQPLSDIHRHGRQALWKIAQAGDPTAAQAIQLLTNDAKLTGEEAARLVDLAQKHPEPGRARFAALGALVRLRPEELPTVVERERARAATGTGQERQEFVGWLSSVHQHERVLQTLPSDAKVKAKDLPLDQLHLKLTVLAETGHWNDLALVLTRDVETVLGPISFNLWHARLAAHKGDGEKSVRQHLDLAFSATDHGQQAAAAVEAAETARRLKLPDLAASYYEGIADKQKSSDRLRVAMLEKALSLHAEMRGTSAMLRLARQIAQLSPDNRPAVFRADYLALLAGESIEIIAFKTELVSGGSETERAQRLLIKAFAAHRLHQQIPEPGALKSLKNFAWPTGQRAVFAAMIASAGDVATAFAVAERIDGALLLPEEAKLLASAQ